MNGISDTEQTPINSKLIGQGRQIDFFVNMVHRYRAEKQVQRVAPRRLHYYIFKLPKEERILPSKGDQTTIYENTLYWSMRCSKLLVDARMQGLIPWDWIIDEKNDELIGIPDRASASITWDVTAPPIRPLPILNLEELPNWNDWLQRINIDYIVSKPVFNNQSYRVCVAIEKATSRSDLERLCSIYGADLLIFGGQFSITRVHDIVDRAQGENRPILLLYISDLDVSGWDMAPAFLERIQEMNPREDHKMIRVALTREQAVEYNLPESFDPDTKGRSKKTGDLTQSGETRIKNFIQETGGRQCVELDALDESILLGLLRTELQKYSGSDEDVDEYKGAVESAKQDKQNIDLGYAGIDDFKDEYEKISSEWNQIVRAFTGLSEQYQNKITEITDKKSEIEYQIKSAILDAYGLEEYDEWDVSR